MGQQQLLLLVLGVIIVGIAVAVGINMFTGASVDANRTALSSDCTHLASKAQQHYKMPITMGGGGNDFNGFALGPMDQTNPNGTFTVAATAPANLAAALAVATTAVSSSTQSMIIIGKAAASVLGRDDTNPVCVYATVSPTSIVGTVLN